MKNVKAIRIDLITEDAKGVVKHNEFLVMIPEWYIDKIKEELGNDYEPSTVCAEFGAVVAAHCDIEDPDDLEVYTRTDYGLDMYDVDRYGCESMGVIELEGVKTELTKLIMK